MKKNNKTLIAIVILAIIIGGATILLVPGKSDAPGSTDNRDKSSESSERTNDNTQNSEIEPAVIIMYDGSKFQSSTDNLKSGEYVMVVNKSNDDLDFDSDPHPAHTDNTELNKGSIAPGESRTFKLVIKGTWGYHNHLNASQKGEVTVK